MRKKKSKCLDMGFVMKNYIKLNLILFHLNNKDLDNCAVWSAPLLFTLTIFMSPPPPTQRVGDILFLVRILSALIGVRFLVSVHSLLNQVMDFDQACIDRLFGEGEELIRFWWPWLYFQGHRGTLKIWFPCMQCTKYGFPVLSSEPVDGFWFWPISHRYIVGRRGRVD